MCDLNHKKEELEKLIKDAPEGALEIPLDAAQVEGCVQAVGSLAEKVLNGERFRASSEEKTMIKQLFQILEQEGVSVAEVANGTLVEKEAKRYRHAIAQKSAVVLDEDANWLVALDKQHENKILPLVALYKRDPHAGIRGIIA